MLASYVTKTRDEAAALRFMKKTLNHHGSPEAITTDDLRSYKAAMSKLGSAEKQKISRRRQAGGELTLPFRRRKRAMLRFRQMTTLQEFASVHTYVYNHFQPQRHLIERQIYKTCRSAGLAERHNVMGRTEAGGESYGYRRRGAIRLTEPDAGIHPVLSAVLVEGDERRIALLAR